MFTGLDISLSGTGLANIGEDGKITYELYGTAKKDFKNRWERIQSIIEYIMKFIENKQTKYVLIEEYMIVPGNILTTIQLVELGAAIRHELYKKGIPFITVMPQMLKKYATGNGNSKKNVVIKELYKNYNIDTNDDNEADACFLALLCRDIKTDSKKKKQIQEIVDKILKEREKINWK